MHSFGDVMGIDGLALRKIRDGARHTQHAMIGASRPVVLRHGPMQDRFGVARQCALHLQGPSGQRAVQLPLTRQLPLPRLPDARCDNLTPLAVGLGGERLGAQRRHFHVQVDAIEQRP